jgi:hypothetical protein
MKNCPHCAASIQEGAIFCSFCGSALPRLKGEAPVWPGAVRFVPRAQWGRISAAVFLAGSIPTVLSYSVLTVLLIFIGPVYPFRSSYVLFHFLVHLLPLALGIVAARAWPGRHPRGNAVLGALAAATEAATIWVFLTVVSPRIQLLSLRWEDFAGLVATTSLFAAGGLFGDLREWPRSPTTRPEPAPERTPTSGSTLRERETDDQRTLQLVQALGPALLALIGTAINAAVALATQP